MSKNKKCHGYVGMDMDAKGDWWFWWINKKSDMEFLNMASIVDVMCWQERLK